MQLPKLNWTFFAATELAAANKKIAEHAARGAAPGGNDEDEVQRLERPKGEAGDKKNGFNLRVAMGLEDDAELYEAIVRAVNSNVARANLDYTVDFRRQDAAKLAAVYKLTRKDFPYLTRSRFPLDWATAEITKQYMRNKRRYAVKRGFIPNRETRSKRRREEDTAEGSNKRRRTTGPIVHIDDQEEDEEEEDA
ncbi:hypothetical protein B0H19DRAFT_1371312 [Mycena capillaripes]|nr:hypothetical protein B0H19DRAFT_1277599 [Mycena capillaripes]KAJ6574034.1 hypothetical protein B0H19DRAFT_1371312 [Mycena capillaripes]